MRLEADVVLYEMGLATFVHIILPNLFETLYIYLSFVFKISTYLIDFRKFKSHLQF